MASSHRSFQQTTSLEQKKKPSVFVHRLLLEIITWTTFIARLLGPVLTEVESVQFKTGLGGLWAQCQVSTALLYNNID